jgi:tetratricopeptide (TPR) repeat protein
MPEETTTWQEALQQGHAEEALKHYLPPEATEDTKDFLEALVTMQALLREKNVPQAKKIITSPATPEWAKGLLSDLTPQLLVLEKAQKDLEKHQPENSLALLASVTHPLLLGEAETLRGTALIYDNDTTNAKIAFEKALSYDPKHYRAMTNLGNMALESNHLEEATSFYERALKINEHFANAHHNLAVAYKRKGEVGKSVRALKQAQRASQQKMREEARNMFKGNQTTKYLRWLFFAGLALVVYFFLKAQR